MVERSKIMYAQVLRYDMKVNLIGGEEVGIPVDSSLVICVDIGDRQDVQEGMSYNEATGEFYWEELQDVIPQPTDAELVQQRLTDIELQNFEAQYERQLLAQQITDLELTILMGGMYYGT